MEGPAIGHTCQFSNVLFVVVREQSDKLDEKATNDFQMNLGAARWNSHALAEMRILALA